MLVWFEGVEAKRLKLSFEECRTGWSDEGWKIEMYLLTGKKSLLEDTRTSQRSWWMNTMTKQRWWSGGDIIRSVKDEQGRIEGQLITSPHLSYSDGWPGLLWSPILMDWVYLLHQFSDGVMIYVSTLHVGDTWKTSGLHLEGNSTILYKGTL